MTASRSAAHAACPVGPNGAGAGIIDARQLVALFPQHGPNSAALQDYEDDRCPITERIVRTSRTAGPDAILDSVEERCGGWFEDVRDVIPDAEPAGHAANSKRFAGHGIEETNAQPRIIPVGATDSVGPSPVAAFPASGFRASFFRVAPIASLSARTGWWKLTCASCCKSTMAPASCSTACAMP